MVGHFVRRTPVRGAIQTAQALAAFELAVDSGGPLASIDRERRSPMGQESPAHTSQRRDLGPTMSSKPHPGATYNARQHLMPGSRLSDRRTGTGTGPMSSLSNVHEHQRAHERFVLP